MEWARQEHRSALCQELEVSMMQLYASTRHWRQAEQTAAQLYATTKNMQDKEKTVKVNMYAHVNTKRYECVKRTMDSRTQLTSCAQHN